ncbi:Nup93/Nic96-domain-containing protein [Bombardia bombarda]|uniref:Nup93/Nic96-domain-containing protein n=1 Tax=Bombardia bombarda TaxID=252184 RepID=A0AA39XJA7_9PEZI|nr:Nup93/Nic96-domain-containing protein [Bombardia bombarda]
MAPRRSTQATATSQSQLVLHGRIDPSIYGAVHQMTRRATLRPREHPGGSDVAKPPLAEDFQPCIVLTLATQEYYIGIDVGTGSARACIIDSTGEIKALAAENIKLWTPASGYGGSHYEQSTTDIWNAICICVKKVVAESKVDPNSVRGIGFDATCSLAVFTHDTDEPVPVTGPDFANDGNDRNVILWLDHRPLAEADKINDTKHNLLRYVGGKMSPEMEVPKVLWLKNNMPPELFDRCKFYDLADALTHIATGNETRSFCSAVCKQGYVPVGVDGSVKGWQEDFYHTIGLDDLVKDDFKRLGGVNGVNGSYMSAGELVGGLSGKAGKELGLPAGIAIGSGVIDAYAGWIGTVGAKVKLSPDHLDETVAANDVSQAFTRLASVAGTSTCHLAMSKDPVFVPGVWGPYRDVLIPEFWMAEGGQSATGELIRHMLETHAAYQETMKEAEAAGKNIYDFLNDHLQHLAVKMKAPSISHLVRHFFFYGDLWGNRSPIADPNMRGAIIGMSSDKSKDSMALLYYSTLEFIALQTRQIIEAMNEKGHTILSIFMSGSQCQNDILMDLIATACGMPVLIPRYVNAAVVHGAAMLGAKAASAKEDGSTEALWDIMDRMSKPGKVVWSRGDPAEKKLLDVKYEIFLDQCRTQQEYRRKVDEALKGSSLDAEQLVTVYGMAFIQLLVGKAVGANQYAPIFCPTASDRPGRNRRRPIWIYKPYHHYPPAAQPTAAATPNPNPFGSLFGNKPATTAPPLSGFGATTNAAQTSNINNASTTTGPAQAQSTGAYFDSLLAKNKKQAEGETALGELPSLQLGLGDLRQRLRQLGPRSQDRTVDGKAHYFLAASGVDPGAAVKDLGAFGLQARAERSQGGWGAAGAGELDVDTYLSNLQTKTTLSMIADGLERSVRDFDSFLEDNVTMEWEAQRKRIYNHFGIKPRDEAADRARSATPAREAQGGFGRSRRSKAAATASQGPSAHKASALGRSVMQRSVIGTPSRIGQHASEFSDVEAVKDAVGAGVPAHDERGGRDKQRKLADHMHALNNARQADQRVLLFSELLNLDLASSSNGSPISEAYKAMMKIAGECPEKGIALKERAFAEKYLDPNLQSPNAIDMRGHILKQANKFLENQFWDRVNSDIAKHPQDANLGGQPDKTSRVKAYVRLRTARKTLVADNVDLQQANGEYIWAVVFYLLRAGLVGEAAQYVNTNQNHFRSIDRTFSGYINSYATSEDRRLKRQMQDRITAEYNQRTRNAPESSIDPFRMACYKIIGRCDVNNRSLDGLQTDVDDWVWLQFNLARETERSKELADESYGLTELQESIRDIGVKHFPKGPSEDTANNYGMFFYLQILSGMFEQAIAYLYPFSYVDAVHFSIALTYYGLLRPADANTTATELLLYSTRGLPQINFGRMLGFYTRDFRAANASAAVDYLVFICLNADEAGHPSHATLCHEALRELVLETREFSKLIGDIKPNGQRIKGLIEERGPLITLGHQEDFMKTITMQAANYADENGRTTDAVLLYHLAGDYDTVVAIINRALSEAVSLEIGEDPMRLVPVKPRVDGSEAAAQPGSSLSLAAIDDPVELAQTMMSIYERDAMFRGNIQPANRNACGLLLQMNEVKGLVEREQWAQCLDKIRDLDILPLQAGGDPGTIRQFASKFSGLAQTVAANVPNLLMWTIVCCTKQRERLLSGQFSGNESTARMMLDELKQISIDLTTYTSQLRYRLPPSLHEALARASAD